MKEKIFVSGGTGFQGRPIVEQLLANGHEVVTISPKAENSSLEHGLNIIPGSFADLNALEAALGGVDKAVFTLPLVFDIELAKQYTSNFIQAAKRNNISLVIFNSSFDLPESDTGLIALDLKVEAKRILDESGLNVITLSPDVYIDNLAAPWSISLILQQGILPYPVKEGQKIPWISHTDLARFVVSALEKPELAGQVLPIGGNMFSGEEIANAISEKVGKSVLFVSLIPDDFEKNLAPNFGDLAAREISNLYRYLDDNIDRITNKNFGLSQSQLNIRPQSLTEWIDSVKWA